MNKQRDEFEAALLAFAKNVAAWAWDQAIEDLNEDHLDKELRASLPGWLPRLHAARFPPIDWGHLEQWIEPLQEETKEALRDLYLALKVDNEKMCGIIEELMDERAALQAERDERYTREEMRETLVDFWRRAAENLADAILAEHDAKRRKDNG